MLSLLVFHTIPSTLSSDAGPTSRCMTANKLSGRNEGAVNSIHDQYPLQLLDRNRFADSDDFPSPNPFFSQSYTKPRPFQKERGRRGFVPAKS